VVCTTSIALRILQDQTTGNAQYDFYLNGREMQWIWDFKGWMTLREKSTNRDFLTIVMYVERP